MAQVTMLHWNLLNYGNKKYTNKNATALLNYVARLIYQYEANIVSLIEIKNAIVSGLATKLMAKVWEYQSGGSGAKNPWKMVYTNSKVNNEAYLIMYRTDKNFVPLDDEGESMSTYDPANGLTNKNASGKELNFPKAYTPKGGRPPFYATFKTTDTMVAFSVLGFHNQFNTYSGFGVASIPHVAPVSVLETQLGYPNVAIKASLISGDYNVYYVPKQKGSPYKDLEDISTAATSEETTLKGKSAPDSSNPKEYRANAYDNIFQKVTTKSNANEGSVPDLLVQSSKISGNTFVASNTYPLFSYAGAFKADISDRTVTDDSQPWVIPPLSVDNGFDLVRELISDHLPVVVTTTI